MYDIVSKRILISRDVIFHEEIYPFHKFVETDQLIDLFPDLVLTTPSLVQHQDPCINQHEREPIPNDSHQREHLSPNLKTPELSPASSIPENQPSPPPSNAVLRRSQRVIKPPAYLKDFHCNVMAQKSPYHIGNFVSYAALSPSHREFVLSVSAHCEPQFFHQAVKLPQWREAMKLELEAMECNNTWSVVPLPQGKHTIGCRWIYKTKYKSDGTVESHKACLVAKGYTQQEGLDYFDTFSPVAKIVTVKVLLALASYQSWHLVQLDVNNAFLNGDLFEEVYMDLPLGYNT